MYATLDIRDCLQIQTIKQIAAKDFQFFGDVQLGFRTMLACAGRGFSLSRLAVHKVFHRNELTLVG